MRMGCLALARRVFLPTLLPFSVSEAIVDQLRTRRDTLRILRLMNDIGIGNILLDYVYYGKYRLELCHMVFRCLRVHVFTRGVVLKFVPGLKNRLCTKSISH